MDVSIKAVTQGLDEAKGKLGGVSDALDKLGISADKTEGAFSSFNVAATAVGTVGLVAVAFAATKAWEKFQEGFTTVTQLGEKLNNLSQVTGMSVERLGGMKLAADVSGTSIEGLSQGIVRFNQHLDRATTGTGASAEAFQRLGINIKGMSSEQAFDTFINKMSQMKDGSEKIAIGTELMGLSFRQLVPLINEGSEGFAKLEAEARKAGIVMSTETARSAQELNTNLAVLKAYGQGFWMEVASPIVESLVRITQAMRDARDADAGFISTMMAGVTRGAADLLFGTPAGDLAANKAQEARLIASIRSKEARRQEPGFRSNSVFDQTLQAEYAALQGVYAARTGIEERIAVETPSGRAAGTTPPPRALRAGKAGATEDQILMSEFEAAEKSAQHVQELFGKDTEAMDAFYLEWERIAEGSVPVLEEIQLRYSRFLKADLDAQEKAEADFRREQEALLKSWDAMEKKYYREASATMAKVQHEEKTAAQVEIDNLRKVVFLTRDERITALEALRQKYHDMGISGQTAEELIQKTMRRTKTDAEVLTEELTKLFNNDIGQSIVRVFGSIGQALSTAIYNFISGTKSLFDSLKGFFTSVVQSILQELSRLAANDIMRWLIGGTSVAAGGGLLSSLFSGAASGAASGATSSAFGGSVGGSVVGNLFSKLFSGGDAGAVAGDVAGLEGLAGISDLLVGLDPTGVGLVALLLSSLGLGKVVGGIANTVGDVVGGVADTAGGILSDIFDFFGFASGTDTVVSHPTLFMAGEAGAEQVTVSPLTGAARSGRGTGGTIIFNGPAMFDEYTFRRFKRMITDNG